VNKYGHVIPQLAEIDYFPNPKVKVYYIVLDSNT
jgi:hypothetical protein